MSWSDLDLSLDLAVVTLIYKILSGLFNARREIQTAAVVLLSSVSVIQIICHNIKLVIIMYFTDH